MNAPETGELYVNLADRFLDELWAVQVTVGGCPPCSFQTCSRKWTQNAQNVFEYLLKWID